MILFNTKYLNKIKATVCPPTELPLPFPAWLSSTGHIVLSHAYSYGWTDVTSQDRRDINLNADLR